MLTMEAITERRNTRKVVEQVMFRVKALYGLSSQSVSLPLSTNDSIESGQVCITIDPEGDPGANIGVIDYSNSKLKVRYAVQAVFPGLHDLVTSGKHDPSLLFPVRVVATDDCTLTENLSGWHALGCLDFLPGSLWAGATGG